MKMSCESLALRLDCSIDRARFLVPARQALLSCRPLHAAQKPPSTLDRAPLAVAHRGSTAPQPGPGSNAMEATTTANALQSSCPAAAPASPSDKGSSDRRTWADAVRCSPSGWATPNRHSYTQPQSAAMRPQLRSASPVVSPPQSPELSVMNSAAAARTMGESPLGPAHAPRLPSISDEDEDETEAEAEAVNYMPTAVDGDSCSEDEAQEDGAVDVDNLGFGCLALEDDASTAGAPGWLLQKLQLATSQHTCKAGFLQMGMDRCCGDSAKGSSNSLVDDELPPEGWETRTSRRDGRPYFFNAVTGESRWPRQRRSSTDRELAAERCNACKTEWIALHDGSQHRHAPTATEAIELAQRRLSADNAARRTLGYQLLAFSAGAHPRLGHASVASILPFDLQEKIGRSLNWHLVGAAAATQFTEEGWAWAATAQFTLRGGFSLGSFVSAPFASSTTLSRSRVGPGKTKGIANSRAPQQARRRRKGQATARVGSRH
jgi:hypothetical protein